MSPGGGEKTFSRCVVIHLTNLVPGLPDLRVAVTQDLRQQLRGLLEAATELIQLLLHGEDTLLQLPIGVVPIGTEVTHDHLHLLKPAAQSNANKRKTLRGPTKAISLSSFVASQQMLHIILCTACVTVSSQATQILQPF